MYNPDDYQIVQEMAREPVNHLVHSESIQTEEGTLFPDYMMRPCQILLDVVVYVSSYCLQYLTVPGLQL